MVNNGLIWDFMVIYGKVTPLFHFGQEGEWLKHKKFRGFVKMANFC